MEPGIVGLSRMRGKMAQRLLDGGRRIIAFDPVKEAVEAALRQQFGGHVVRKAN